MNERAIFTEALDRDTPADRAAYLDTACAGDPALRERVEALLRSHEQAGEFPGKPAPRRLAEEFAAGALDDTRTEPPAGDPDEPLGFLEPSDQPDSLGRLGHYEVREVVGRGGMGVVLKAFDEQLHRVVAIKVMAPQLATSATARKRFVREARAQAAVTHDHVVTIHAVDDAGPLPHIVMQFVAGQSLQDRLDRSGPLHLPEVLRIGMQAAAGLAAAHAQGLVHRDVKPANILLENGVERVKLTDFGLARAADDASLTQSGAVAGTPAFMSPEQAEGKPVDARSDLFSLGSVLYAMGTGRPPFRAGTSMGVLKRVCEDTPAPIREANPEIPDWLAAVVEKLHAKDPAARFQSAAEVADVLGRHLAHVQHPSVVPLPAVVTPPARPIRHRRWVVAAGALLALLAGLGTTEATGVTNVRATVVRIFTPDGTLVVETDDPAVKVTVEGDGDLVITGAGPQEVRLRAGSYRLTATKDGKPVRLDRDLVAISKGDRQTVRVRLEGEPLAAAAPPTERGPFVLLGGQGVEVSKFDTLAEAVRGATAGDTIEVRGNGPFVSDPITVGQPLVIRAGAGYVPSIVLNEASAKRNFPLLNTSAPLVLEGLELRFVGGTPENVEGRWAPMLLVANHRGSLSIANCRLIFKAEAPYVGYPFDAIVTSLSVRNSVVTGNVDCTSWRYGSGGRCAIENCVSVAGGIGFSTFVRDVKDVTIRFRGNTIVGNCLTLVTAGEINLPESEATPPVHLEISGNVARWDVETRNNAFLWLRQIELKKPASGRAAEAFLRRLVGLSEKQNLYQSGKPMLGLLEGKRGQDLADWDRFWAQTKTGSVEGDIRFQGGDLMSRARSAPERISAEDFRLRPDSAGYRAGKDGKDLGADVDLVGPGAAYERWKKTPEYQAWLKDTGQLRAQAQPQPKAEPGAFVVLGGKGIAERKFDTLAEAVQGAGAGDTIEIRGNGPFACDPVIVTRALTIRAATGFLPVIKGNARPVEEGVPVLLRTQAPLVLEGLELHMRGPGPALIVRAVARGERLHVANCRFVLTPLGQSLTVQGPDCTIRNCEFAGTPTNGHVLWPFQKEGKLTLENNLFRSRVGYALGLDCRSGDIHDVAVELKHNTVLSPWYAIALGISVVPEAAPGKQRFRMNVSANLFDFIDRTDRKFFLLIPPDRFAKDGTPLSIKDAEQLLPRLMAWSEERNLYGKGANFLSLRHVTDPSDPKKGYIDKPLPGFQTLDDWQRLWSKSESGSSQDDIRYAGGDVFARMATAPELLTAADFRLRPDSAGYRAGKDGKDVGADVDLVGPGPAYERWKKSPDYQQWLRETGQLKK
jgi:hypothetical protein